ncbi:MAG TPA: hypothetical protein VF691_08680 [Cytophagaceae bacterium]
MHRHTITNDIATRDVPVQVAPIGSSIISAPSAEDVAIGINTTIIRLGKAAGVTTTIKRNMFVGLSRCR